VIKGFEQPPEENETCGSGCWRSLESMMLGRPGFDSAIFVVTVVLRFYATPLYTPRYNGIAAAGFLPTYSSVVRCARLTLSRCCDGCAVPGAWVTVHTTSVRDSAMDRVRACDCYDLLTHTWPCILRNRHGMVSDNNSSGPTHPRHRATCQRLCWPLHGQLCPLDLTLQLAQQYLRGSSL
jgi:hypothetical protein